MKISSFIFACIMFTLVGCGQSRSIPNDPGAADALKNQAFFDKVGAVKAYNPYQQFANKMQECVYAATSSKSCIVSDLPLLGMTKAQITVQDVLDRTLVSHDFLAVAFREVLLRMPAESLQMFGAVNAIVISDKINPSFFYSMTGAIYLSGRYFWSNLDERDLVSQVRDSRSDAAFSLSYLFDGDYINNGKSYQKRAHSNVQTYEEMTPKAARVIFHELTHANDFFPRKLYSQMAIDNDKSYYKTAISHYDNKEIPSMNLVELKSKKLAHVADILYFAEPASAQDQATKAQEIIDEFKSDYATDFYNYSNNFEDLAMNAEEALMLYYYNMPRYVAVIQLPSANFSPPENYNYDVAWGEKSRVSDVGMKNRAVYAVQNDLGTNISNKVSDRLDATVSKEIPAHSTWEQIYAL